MDVNFVSFGGGPWLGFAFYRFLDALFTGLMLAGVLAFAVRFLKVRGVTFKVEVDSRDQDRDD